MTSIKLMEIILAFSIGAVVNGNLITLDGKCPFRDLKPAPLNAAALLDAATLLLRGQTSLAFNSIAETVPLSGYNRTDITSFLEHVQLPDAKIGVVKFTKHFRSTETGQCNHLEIIFKPTFQPGIYDLIYQVAPNTNFIDYKGIFLSMNPLTMTAVGFICQNLPNVQYQFEIAVFSALTTEYNEGTKEETNRILEFNNLGYLSQYLGAVERKNKCV